MLVWPAPRARRAAGQDYTAYVGNYTGKTGSKGIYTFQFDAAKGTIEGMELAGETENPSFVAVHPSGKYLYAVNESGKSSMVSAFSIDRSTHKLTLLNHVPALGEDPCFISFDRTGKYVLIANYSSGSTVVFPILADGKLGEKTSFVKHEGDLGPNKERQEAPHAHWIEVTPDNRFVLSADLGLDEVMVYRFDAAHGTLTPNKPPFAKVDPGSGPRHIAFHPDGKYVYVLSEMASTVTAFHFNAEAGTLHQFQVISALPKDFSGRNDAAEIMIHPNGKFLYTSNRGHDTIAVFAIDPTNGTLKQIADVSTGGKEPRHFLIDPTGKFLLAENQFSDNITVFRIDPKTGGLTPTGEKAEVPSPVDVAFSPKH